MLQVSKTFSTRNPLLKTDLFFPADGGSVTFYLEVKSPFMNVVLIHADIPPHSRQTADQQVLH